MAGMIGLVILAAVFICYALVAGRLDRWSITGPIVLVLTGAFIGLGTPEWLADVAEPEAVEHIAELTLALILFADASTLRWDRLREDGGLPARLLLIGFPLTVLAGYAVGAWLFPNAGWAPAALAASILAPTDAALGLGVFTNRAVPARIRRALNVESGLNDGMATPLVTLFLALMIAQEGAGPEHWAAASLRQLGVGVIVALIVGGLSGRLIAAAHERELTSEISERLAVLATGLLAYGGAVAADGNGFVSAFVAGLVFAAVSNRQLREPVEFTEDLGLFASFLVWGIFGALLVAPSLRVGVSAPVIFYAILSLTLVRMVPVAISMIGSGLRRESVLFMGWFGPRGLASVVFTLIAFETLEHGDPASTAIIEIATWTIFLSVLAHGLTARPLAKRYGRQVANEPVETSGASEIHGSPVPRALGISPIESGEEPPTR